MSTHQVQVQFIFLVQFDLGFLYRTLDLFYQIRCTSQDTRIIQVQGLKSSSWKDLLTCLYQDNHKFD